MSLIINPFVFGSGGGGGCDPSAIDASATGWFDGSAASFNGSMSDGTAVGDTTSRWQNRLNTARYFSQGTAANRPTFHTGGPNGENYVSFDGSNDSLAYSVNSSFLVASSGWTLFFVVKAKENGDDNYILGSGGYYGVRITSSGGNRFQHIRFGSSPSGYVAVNSTSTYSTSGWYVVEAYKDASNIYIKVNNDTEVSSAANGPSSLLDAPALGFGVNMDLAYFAAFNTEIGSTKRTTLRNCLGSRYGITV